jgi:hypothetical protein
VAPVVTVSARSPVTILTVTIPPVTVPGRPTAAFARPRVIRLAAFVAIAVAVAISVTYAATSTRGRGTTRGPPRCARPGLLASIVVIVVVAPAARALGHGRSCRTGASQASARPDATMPASKGGHRTFARKNPAATYSPRRMTSKYHRRGRA